MKRLVSRPVAACCLLAGAALAPLASADDWRQYRHDQRHTATSTDRVKYPMTEIWSWTGNTVPMSSAGSPLYHAVVWKERVFFTATERTGRYLVAADARTGTVAWKQKLEAQQLGFQISDIAGPAVTDRGTVFVYDKITIPREVVRQIVDPEGCRFEPRPTPSFAVRAFNGITGQPQDCFCLALMAANGVIPRLSLIHSPLGQETYPVPPKIAGCPP